MAKKKNPKKKRSYKMVWFYVKPLGIAVSSFKINFKIRFLFYVIIHLFQGVFKSLLNETCKLCDTFSKLTKVKETENYSNENVKSGIIYFFPTISLLF